MYLDSLVARGLISPDALANLLQNVNDVGNRGPANLPIEAGGGRGVGGAVGPGSSGKVIAPDYSALQARINALPKDSPVRKQLEEQLGGMSSTYEYNPPVQKPEIVPDEEIVERMKPARYGPAKGTKYRPRSQ